MLTFEREVCRRLPLADTVLRLLDFCTPEDFLDQVFDCYRGHSYQDILTFPQSVHLFRATLLNRQHSAHQRFQKAQEQGALSTCVEALSGKLRRVPLTLSQGLLQQITARLRQVFPNATDPLPARLDNLEVLAGDGKKIEPVSRADAGVLARRGEDGRAVTGLSIEAKLGRDNLISRSLTILDNAPEDSRTRYSLSERAAIYRRQLGTIRRLLSVAQESIHLLGR